MSSKTAQKISILVVDDNAAYLQVVAELLKKCNYQGTFTRSLVMSLSFFFSFPIWCRFWNAMIAFFFP